MVKLKYSIGEDPKREVSTFRQTIVMPKDTGRSTITIENIRYQNNVTLKSFYYIIKIRCKQNQN